MSYIVRYYMMFFSKLAETAVRLQIIVDEKTAVNQFRSECQGPDPGSSTSDPKMVILSYWPNAFGSGSI